MTLPSFQTVSPKPRPGEASLPGLLAQRREIAVCNKIKTQYNIPMRKKTAQFKLPDDEKDREQIIKEAEKRLEEIANDPVAMGRLVELAKVLMELKAKEKK